MFMSALWDTIFEINDTHKECSVFLIDNHIPALCFGNPDKPCVYLGGFGSEEWESSVILLKFFDELLTAAETSGTMAGIAVKKAMQNRGVVIVPAVCPQAMTYEGTKINIKNLLPLAKYVAFHKAGLLFTVSGKGDCLVCPNEKYINGVDTKTVGNIISACSKIPVSTDKGGISSEFRRWAETNAKLPAYSLFLNTHGTAEMDYEYSLLKETLLVGALL